VVARFFTPIQTGCVALYTGYQVISWGKAARVSITLLHLALTLKKAKRDTCASEPPSPVPS